ncbi:unnamed protein product, partial [marine sediment metagenome]
MNRLKKFLKFISSLKNIDKKINNSFKKIRDEISGKASKDYVDKEVQNLENKILKRIMDMQIINNSQP